MQGEQEMQWPSNPRRYPSATASQNRRSPARSIGTSMLADVTALSGQHRPREVQQPSCLPQRDRHVFPAREDHPVLRLVFPLDEPPT